MTSTEKAKAGLPLGGLEWGLRGLAWASDAAQAGGGGAQLAPGPGSTSARTQGWEKQTVRK